MKEKLIKRIKELTSLIGISGQEWDVAKYIYDELKNHVDSIEIRPNGQVIAIKRGSKAGPRVMITAHMDEVGYTVRNILPNGYLLFEKRGAIATACLPGRRVLVKGTKGVVMGLIGVRSGHMPSPEQAAKAQTVDQSYIDIFVNSAEEAAELGIEVGSQIVPDSACEAMNGTDFYCTRAADCRLLCAITMESLINIPVDEIRGEICAVFGVLEETVCSTISAAISYLNPLYGIFLDTIPCGDVPDINQLELPVALNQGPVLVKEQALMVLTKHVVSHPKLVTAFKNGCRKLNLEHQEVHLTNILYVTEAINSHSAGNGIASITMAIPRRYSHSPVEVFNLNDAVKGEKIVEWLLKNPLYNLNPFEE